MGTAICIEFIKKMESADWIAAAGLLVNSALAFWIVKTIQNKLTNKRVLKDHFISEIKDLRSEYKIFLEDLYNDKIIAKNALAWFKLVGIKADDLINFLHKKYKVDKKRLRKYHMDLHELVTNNSDYINQFNTNTPIVFSENSKRRMIQFQQNNQIFNDLIVFVNDAD